MKITAAILNEMGRPRPYAESRPLEITEVDLNGPGEGEVLVEIRAAGLCHSDLSVIDGSRPRPMPMALGHEAAGVVVECGAGVDDLTPGDHVILVFVPSCGHCVPCMEGRPALCEPGAKANGAGTLLSGERRLTRRGQAIQHHLGVSAFAQYAVVSRRSVVPVNRDIAIEDAALFGCAVLTGLGAVVNTARVKPGTSMAVVGLGGVGLNALMGGVLVGAHDIVAVDLQPAKLELAREIGATAAFDANDPDCIAKVREATKGGVDYAFEMAGAVPALEMAFAITRRGGVTVTAGLPHYEKRLALSPVTLVAEERVLMGSYVGSCIPGRDIPRYVDLYKRGRLPIDRLRTATLPLSGINEAFDRLADGGVVRQIVLPHQQVSSAA